MVQCYCENEKEIDDFEHIWRAASRARERDLAKTHTHRLGMSATHMVCGLTAWKASMTSAGALLSSKTRAGGMHEKQESWVEPKLAGHRSTRTMCARPPSNGQHPPPKPCTREGQQASVMGAIRTGSTKSRGRRPRESELRCSLRTREGESSKVGGNAGV